jgi:hypothetical protein
MQRVRSTIPLLMGAAVIAAFNGALRDEEPNSWRIAR